MSPWREEAIKILVQSVAFQINGTQGLGDFLESTQLVRDKDWARSQFLSASPFFLI